MIFTKTAKFIRNYLLKLADYRYSSAQLLFPNEIVENFKRYREMIDPADVLLNRGNPIPHITVQSGLHSFNPDRLKKMLVKIPPVKVRIGNVSLFENDDADVLKFDIESDQLNELNKLLSTLPHTKLYDKYNPHATIAYLKPGTGKKYLDKFTDLIGKEFVFSNVEFSDKKGNKYIFPFRSTIYDSAEYDPELNLWKLIDNKGYVRLYKDKPTPRNFTKFLYEHRQRLIDHLGRELLKNEIVHHIDKNKLNNIIDNLELLSDRMEHIKKHPEWRMRNVTSET